MPGSGSDSLAFSSTHPSMLFKNLRISSESIVIKSKVLAGRIAKDDYSQVPKARYGELAASATGLAASLAPAIPFMQVAPDTALFIVGLRAIEYCIGAALGWILASSPKWIHVSR